MRPSSNWQKYKKSDWEKLSSYLRIMFGLKFSGLNYFSPTLFIGEFSIVSWLDLHNRRRTAPNVSKSHIITLAFASSVSTNAGKVGLWNFQLGHCKAFRDKVHIFWSHKILRNLHQLFVLCTASQIIGGDFAKCCGLLRIYEL